MAHETVLVTGASSGIGRELAKCFAAEGSRLALVARSKAALDAVAAELRRLYPVDARTFSIDLARPEAASQVLTQIQAAGFKIDVLVNNAGFGAQGRFADIPIERQLQMLQLNMTTLTHLSRLLLPRMIDRGQGGLLNVASTAAFQPGPHMAVYYATKAYVLSLTESIAEEVRGTGVSITALCPGPTQTNFAEAAAMRPSLLMKIGGMSAAKVAEIGYRGFRNKRVVVIPGLGNNLLTFAVRFAPRWLVRKITGTLNAAR